MTPTGGPIAPAVPAAEYAYVGLGHLVGTTLPEPEARWVLSEHATSGDLYPDLDRFDRVVLSRWTGYRNSGTRDFYSVALTYDRNSNVTGATDHVHKNVGGNRNFDARYAMDGLDRLTRAEEGTLTFPGGVPTLSNRSRDEQWTLLQTGNWTRTRGTSTAMWMRSTSWRRPAARGRLMGA